MLISNVMNWTRGVGLSFGDEEGQDLAEYALVLVFIAVVAVAGVTTLGGTVSGIFDQITSGLSG